MNDQLPKTADIVVIGGGVMGASSAYHLALAGVKSVALLDKEAGFGLGATGRCAGGVRYQFGTEVNVRLSIASLSMLERFKQDTGQDCDYRQCGYLFVLTDEADIPVFERNREMQRSLGVEVEWLTGDEIRARLPMMRFEDAVAGTIHSKDGLADPNGVVMGYIRRARQLGVELYTETEVRGIEVRRGGVQSVKTNRGDIACTQVINAAGPWAARVGEMAGVEIPISPVRRQMVTTTPLPDLPTDFPFVIDFSQSLYFHQEGEGILTGMSNPKQAVGYDQSIDAEWDLVAMQAAVQRLPMLANAGRVSGWAGLYEVTPDALPIYGPTPVDGFWVVAGFSGHGFMHGPISGKIMAEFLTQGASSSVDVAMLDLARFEQGRPVQEYNVI